MIDPEAQAVFPNNVVKCLTIVLPSVDPDAHVFNRPLRGTDPNYSIGVYGTLWTPDEQSYEMGRTYPSQPSLQQYQIGIQTLIKDSDTVRALAVGSIFTKRVRTVLYTNEPLRVALGQLQVVDGDTTESFTRSGIRTQRYLSNDIEGAFVFISVIDFYVETETR